MGLVLLTGCSRITFWNAERMEARGAFAQAAKEFKGFADRNPGHPKAPEALYRAAVDLGQKLGLCDDARPLWEDAARSGAEPWAGRSREALLECPDFFPLKPGYEWTYVDAQTGGQNMRESVVSKKDGALERKIFAGSQLVDARTLRYKKAGWEIRQGDGQPLLKFPFRKGAAWSLKEGKRTVLASIAEAGLAVRTRAGSFTGCLKVKQQVAGIDSAWKYDFYCPEVGRVKTTVAGPGFEHPNTELSAFKKP